MAGQNAAKLIKKYVAVLKEHGIPFTRVVLFGSHAKRKASPHSDIDVAVFSREFGKDCIWEGFTLMKLSQLVDLRIEPIPFNEKKILDQTDPILHEIRTHGIRIA